MQFSPLGGNGTVLTSSDVVVMPAGLEPGITSLRGLRPVRLDEGTIYYMEIRAGFEPVITAVKGLRPILLDERTIEAGVSAPDRKFRNDL